MSQDECVREFVLGFLREIGAGLQEKDGVYTVAFPPGRKRRFGRERRFTFDAALRQPQVELIETGSPLLKLFLMDAKQWGGFGVCTTDLLPDRTLVYIFQFDAYSSVRKRTQFVHATLLPDSTSPTLAPGISECHLRGRPGPADSTLEADRVQDALPMVLKPVEAAARRFAEEAIAESRESFERAVGRLKQYFEGLKHETFLEEARIKKRLGEIQSKLYFTEDGRRELKLQREQEKLTKDLHRLRQHHTQADDHLEKDETGQLDKQRRRHEPKLRIRLVAVTLVRAPQATERVSSVAAPIEALSPAPA